VEPGGEAVVPAEAAAEAAAVVAGGVAAVGVVAEAAADHENWTGLSS